ncbi:hypothetical protein BCR42DRAFT_421379 [Absidia repens]|uniref:Uncharacterized protein n=1 Tax=Absidia repens TaxID=90262 RepID=A0A1X2I8I1_9FUNG|nr:hypothetical protein BCR42DRAFT_421379 [Absidia repens]
MNDSPHSPIKQIPTTPSRSISTPIVDAFRHAHQNATREFDQFYGYISKVMTPRRSQQHQPQQQSQIHKATPKNTTRIRQQLDQNHQRSHKSSSSLTPLMANHSLRADRNDNSGEPTWQRSRRDYPPPRPMTLTPNTVRTSSTTNNSLLQLDDDNDDDNKSNVYLHSPQRSTLTRTPTPSRHHYESPFPIKRYAADPDATTPSSSRLPPLPPSPSMFLQGQLLDESRRLDQLQQSFDVVQQRCLALISGQQPHNSKRRRQQQRHPYDDPSSSLHSRFYYNNHQSTTTRHTTPPPRQGGLRAPRLFEEEEEQEPPVLHNSPPLPRFSIPSSTPATALPQRTTSTTTTTTPPRSLPIPIPSSLPLPSSPPTPPPPPPSAPSSSQPKQQDTSDHRDVLTAIPKAQLRSAETVTTPNGTRVKNKFWTEIHGESDPTHQEDGASFWIHDDDDDDQQQQQQRPQKRRSQLTNRLEQVKSNEENNNGSHHHTTTSPSPSVPSPPLKPQQQHRHYPADFFEELTHTLKGKSIQSPSQ